MFAARSNQPAFHTALQPSVGNGASLEVEACVCTVTRSNPLFFTHLPPLRSVSVLCVKSVFRQLSLVKACAAEASTVVEESTATKAAHSP